jgi:putative transposase
VVWDNGSNHKGEPLRALLRRFPRPSLERLPAYAPELSPVETVWAHLKYGRMANFVSDEVQHLNDVVIERLTDAKLERGKLEALWQGSDLPLPTRQSPLSDQ